MMRGSFEVAFLHVLPKGEIRTPGGHKTRTSLRAELVYSPIPAPRWSMEAALWFARCNAKLAGIAMGRALRQLRTDDTILARSASHA